MEEKVTLVIGASENPERYSSKAIKSLRRHGHPVKALGLKAGRVEDVQIETGRPAFEGIDTVTLYMSQKNQIDFIDYILSLKPKRIIFNPGAENEELEAMAIENKIEPLEACTLVMLATNQY